MREPFITTFFPVPKILVRHAVGFDLSSESIKIIELAKKGGQLRLVRAEELPLAQGTIQSGTVENPKSFQEALLMAKKKSHIDRVVVSLPEEKSYIFTTALPALTRKEIRNAVELTLEEHVPLPPDQIVFDYEIIRFRPHANEVDVSVAAMPKTLVQSYSDSFTEAGIAIMRIYPECAAVARAIVPENEKGTTLLVDFGHERTGISIAQGNKVVFNTVLEFGAIDITRAVMKDFNLPYEEAEKLKKEHGVREGGDKNLFPSSLASLAVLKDEIHKYQSYWDDRVVKEHGGEKITQMIFSGGGSALPGLAEFLASYIDIPFSIANPWVNVFSFEKEIPTLSRNDSLRFATAIGLALIEHDTLNYD